MCPIPAIDFKKWHNASNDKAGLKYQELVITDQRRFDLFPTAIEVLSAVSKFNKYWGAGLRPGQVKSVCLVSLYFGFAVVFFASQRQQSIFQGRS